MERFPEKKNGHIDVGLSHNVPRHDGISHILRKESEHNSIEREQKKSRKKKKNQNEKKGILDSTTVVINPYDNRFLSSSSLDSQSDLSSLSSAHESSGSSSGSDEEDAISVKSEDTPMPRRIPIERSASSSTLEERNLPIEEQQRRKRQKREEAKVGRLVAMAKQQQNFAQAWFAAATSALPSFGGNSNRSNKNLSPTNKKKKRRKKPKLNSSSSSTSSRSQPIDIDTGEVVSFASSDEESPKLSKDQGSKQPPPCCECMPDDDRKSLCRIKSYTVRFKHAILLLILTIIGASIFLVFTLLEKPKSNKATPVSNEVSRIQSFYPSNTPSALPVTSPTLEPSLSIQTISPTTDIPTFVPSLSPTLQPSSSPSNVPSNLPSNVPSNLASAAPSTYFSSTRYVPLGDPLISESWSDSKGYSVALSADGRIQAVGSRHYPLNTIRRGSVDVYRLTEQGNWTQVGNKLIGRNDRDEFGYSISLSKDGTILAASEPLFNSNSGNVRVFTLGTAIDPNDGTSTIPSWNKLGNDINITEPSAYFGVSVSLSADGSILAVGAPSAGEFNIGRVYTYQFQSEINTWKMMGTFLEGTLLNDYFGWDVSLNSKGTVLVCGAPRRPSGGLVKVFQRSTTSQEWTSLGSEITGPPDVSPIDNWFGYSVSVSDDGNRIAVGSPRASPSIALRHSGMSIVYSLSSNGNEWVPLGDILWGEKDRSQSFGWAVSISGDGHTVFVGAPGHKSRQGATYTYNYNGNSWISANPLTGIAPKQNFGFDVDINTNGTILLVGAPFELDPEKEGSIHAFSRQP